MTTNPLGPARAQAFGLMRIAGALIALPVADLREVICMPPAFLALPVPAPGLCGAVRLRGTIIPVIDLRSHLGLQASDPAASERVIVVMRHEAHLLGLLAQSVDGVAQVDPERLQALRVTSALSPAIATHAFELGDEAVSVLDAAQIAHLPGVPMVREAVEPGARRHAGSSEPILLFRSRGVSLAIAAMCVEATVPRAALRNSSLAGDVCQGVISHHGHQVPVVDTLPLVGLAERRTLEETAVLVLRLRSGLLGLSLDEVCDIVHVNPQDILPLQPFGLADPALFRGMVCDGSGQHHLLLDGTELQARELLDGLSSMSLHTRQNETASKGAREDRRAGVAQPYLTYRIEVETASPLPQASEILRYPEAVLPLNGTLDAALGLFVHRGSAIPLICLATLLGRSIELDPEAARVLIVEDAGRKVGLVVQSLCSIENATWEQSTTASEKTLGAATRGMQPLVEVCQGELRRTLPRLDLLQVVRGLRTEPAAALPRPSITTTKSAIESSLSRAG